MNKYDSENAEARLSALLAEYMHVIKREALRYNVGAMGLGREDLELEGMMGLLRAARGWLPDAGASFSTYAGRCIRNAISSAAAAASRDKHQPLNTGVSLDEDILSASGVETPEAHSDASELRSELLEAISTALSSFEREALTLHLTGLSAAQTAERLGRTPKSIENALARARKKIKSKTAD